MKQSLISSIVMSVWSVIVACSCAPLSAFATQAIAQEPETIHEAPLAPGEVILVYEDNAVGFYSVENLSVLKLCASYGVEDKELLADNLRGMGDAYCLTLPDANAATTDAFIEALNNNPNVALAQPNYRYALLDQEQFAAADEAAFASADELVAQQGMQEAAAEGLQSDAREFADANKNHTSNTFADQVILNPQGTFVNDPLAAIATYDAVTGSDGLQNQWWLHQLRGFDAWDISRVEGAVTVAVLDTGVNFSHPDLVANLDTAHAYNAYTRTPLTTNPASADYAHGSHVAGIIAGQANNEIGIAGISYNAKILPIQVFYDNPDPTEEVGALCTDDATLLQAYAYLFSDPEQDGTTIAEEAHVRVINMSLGNYGDADYALAYAIQSAADRGVLTVAAGGNGDGEGNPNTEPTYPADYEAALSVVCTDNANGRPFWADYNQYKDIAAPGMYIWSTWYTGDAYYCTSGTSMASPMVAGVAAQMFALYPELTPQECKDILCNTAIDLGAQGRDDYYGYGLLNPVSALEATAQLGGVDIQMSIDEAVVAGLENQIYTGQEIEPQIVVTLDDVVLQQGKDYVLTFEDNVEVGTAKVLISGIGAYRGSKHEQFSICYDLAAKGRVRSISDRDYTGAPILPTVTVLYGQTNLKKDIDYTLSYERNVLPGTATIRITGIGAYTGTLIKTFKIVGGKEMPHFVDVGLEEGQTPHWVVRYGILQEAVAAGLIAGSTDANGNPVFRPDEPITRCQVAVILHRAAGQEVQGAYPANTTPFTDVADGTYYTAAMNWAYETGVYKGESDGTGGVRVRPNDPISRQEFAAVLMRYTGGQGSADAFASAPDASQVARWAGEALGWAYAKEVLTGKQPSGRLAPTENATRAEGTKMIWTAINL